MQVLLDTHIFLWWIQDNKQQLSKSAQALIQNASIVYVSSASILEIAIKAKLGKLKVNVSELIGAISASSFTELPVTAVHAVQTYQLADIHLDPFDRLLIAQAMTEPMKFLTADAKLKKYSELVELV